MKCFQDMNCLMNKAVYFNLDNYCANYKLFDR